MELTEVNRRRLGVVYRTSLSLFSMLPLRSLGSVLSALGDAQEWERLRQCHGSAKVSRIRASAMAGRAFGMFNEAKFRNVYTYGWMPSWTPCECLEQDQPRRALKSSPDTLRCCHYGLCRRRMRRMSEQTASLPPHVTSLTGQVNLTVFWSLRDGNRPHQSISSEVPIKPYVFYVGPL